jgi:pilus assembly protein CpaB
MKLNFGKSTLRALFKPTPKPAAADTIKAGDAEFQAHEFRWFPRTDEVMRPAVVLKEKFGAVWLTLRPKLRYLRRNTPETLRALLGLTLQKAQELHAKLPPGLQIVTSERRRVVLLGAAIGMALLAGALVSSYLNHRQAEIEARYLVNKATVVVPQADMKKGSVIQFESYAYRPMQRDVIPPDAVTPEEMEQAVGQKLQIDLPKGRPLLWSYLSSGRNKSFSEMIDDNKRALTITVDELNSINGMIRPTDRIDMFIISRGSRDADKAVMPLMQDVLVKATGNIVRRETNSDGSHYDRNYSTLTLDLAPEDIGKVLIAQESGELKVALKHASENNAARYKPTRQADLWNKSDAASGSVADRRKEMETIRQMALAETRKALQESGISSPAPTAGAARTSPTGFYEVEVYTGGRGALKPVTERFPYDPVKRDEPAVEGVEGAVKTESDTNKNLATTDTPKAAVEALGERVAMTTNAGATQALLAPASGSSQKNKEQ